MSVFKEKYGHHCIKAAIYDPTRHAVLLEFFCNEGFVLPLKEATAAADAEVLTKLVGYWVRMHGTNDQAKMEVIFPDENE